LVIPSININFDSESCKKSMKKNLLFLILSSCFLSVFCQEKKDESPANNSKFTFGAFIGSSYYNLTSSGGTSGKLRVIKEDVLDLISFHGEYSITSMFSAGILYEIGGLLTDPDFNIETPYNDFSINNAGINFKMKFISRDKDNVYFNILPVYSRMRFRDKSGVSDYVFESNGFGLKGEMGWEHYFGKHIGMGLQSCYTFSRFRADVFYTIQNQSYIDVVKNTYSGLGAGLGLLFRF
jgi:hypothetical protein